jgi:hypothetical protein
LLSAQAPEKLMKAMAARAGESMPVGNEGAGVVIKGGWYAAAQALPGTTVAMIGGAMYAQHRTIKVEQCLLPAGQIPTCMEAANNRNAKKARSRCGSAVHRQV